MEITKSKINGNTYTFNQFDEWLRSNKFGETQVLTGYSETIWSIVDHYNEMSHCDRMVKEIKVLVLPELYFLRDILVTIQSLRAKKHPRQKPKDVSEENYHLSVLRGYDSVLLEHLKSIESYTKKKEPQNWVPGSKVYDGLDAYITTRLSSLPASRSIHKEKRNGLVAIEDIKLLANKIDDAINDINNAGFRFDPVHTLVTKFTEAGIKCDNPHALAMYSVLCYFNYIPADIQKKHSEAIMEHPHCRESYIRRFVNYDKMRD